DRRRDHAVFCSPVSGGIRELERRFDLERSAENFNSRSAANSSGQGDGLSVDGPQLECRRGNTLTDTREFLAACRYGKKQSGQSKAYIASQHVVKHEGGLMRRRDFVLTSG